MTIIVYLLASAIIGGIAGGFVVLYIVKRMIDRIDHETTEGRR